MLEKFKHVSNPLTIIAIFAGVSEISMTVALAYLRPDLQGIFIGFIMGFPIFLVGLFFWTLNRNHKVLYAPSDFKSDDAFMKLAMVNNRMEDAVEKIQAAQTEIEATVGDNEQVKEIAKEALSSAAESLDEAKIYFANGVEMNTTGPTMGDYDLLLRFEADRTSKTFPDLMYGQKSPMYARKSLDKAMANGWIQPIHDVAAKTLKYEITDVGKALIDDYNKWMARLVLPNAKDPFSFPKLPSS